MLLALLLRLRFAWGSALFPGLGAGLGRLRAQSMCVAGETSIGFHHGLVLEKPGVIEMTDWHGGHCLVSVIKVVQAGIQILIHGFAIFSKIRAQRSPNEVSHVHLGRH